jgi:hypothetical protein
MKKEFKELPQDLREKNIVAAIATYVILVMIFIFSGGIQFGAGWDGLLFGGIVLFLLCPAASVAVFAFLLFIEYHALSGTYVDLRYIRYYRTPEEGTIGNPKLDDLIGRKGVLFVRIILVALLLFIWFEIYCSVEESGVFK